jgi:hypothetical protein
MQTAEGRQRVISDLPPELVFSITHSNVPNIHVSNIMDRCIQIPGGLRRLLNVLTFYEGGTRNLKRAVQAGVLVDLLEIVQAEVGEEQVEAVVRAHLPQSVQMTSTRDLWTGLIGLWTKQEMPHPLIQLFNRLFDALPLAQTELMELRDWIIAHPVLDLRAEPLYIATAPRAKADPNFGDLLLNIRRTDDRTLAFSLHSPTGKLPYHHVEMGSIRLDHLTDLRAKLETLIPRLNMYAAKPVRSLPQQEADESLRQIENIGIDLYDALFPHHLKDEYPTLLQHRDAHQQAEGRALTWVISSDEPWIPWELVRPSLPAADFLAADFALLRHLPGANPGDHLTLRTGHLVRPSLDLEMVAEEHATLSAFTRGRFILAEPISTLQKFLALCQQGGTQLLHVATHGGFDAHDIPLSPIKLEDGEVILQDLNRLRASGLIADKPLVFLNACHSGRLGLDLVGPDGWAKRFIKDFGVTAFIGSQWEIQDDLSALFSQEFYGQLAAGKRLGQAVHQARKSVRVQQPANPTWLAYACYGNPECRIEWGKV